MLGNNADAFFTTPMRHSVVRGGNVGNQAPMPIPRDPNSSATGVVYTKAGGDFMPGIGDDTTPAAAPTPVVAVPADNTKNLLMLGAVAFGAYMLLK